MVYTVHEELAGVGSSFEASPVQNTLSGLDLTLKFEWLGCDGENATWVGGFDWDNC